MFWRYLASIALVFLAVWYVGRRDDWKRSRIPDSVLEAFHDAHRVSALRVTDTLDTVFRLTLPETVSAHFELSLPVFLAAKGAPLCRIVVGDPIDRAVHVFDTHGGFLHSISGDGKDGRPRFDALTGVDVTIEGDVLATTGDGLAVRFDREGALVSRTILGPKPVRAGNASAVVGGAGLLFEHWFSDYADPSPSSEEMDGAPLVHVRDSRGHVVADLGTVHMWPGRSLSYQLNRGFLELQPDTLWFARRSDARLMAFDALGRTRDPLRVIDIPVFFEAAKPIEYVSAEEVTATRIQTHIHDFDMDEAGVFYFAQNFGWPGPQDVQATFVAQSVITAVDPDGKLLGVYVTGRSPGRIAATRDVIVATVRGDGGRMEIRGYVNPLAGRVGVCSGGGHTN